VSRFEDELVWQRWRRNIELQPSRDAVIHWVAGEEPYRWTNAALHATAERLAAALLEHEIEPGAVCAIISRHHRLFYPLYLAISYVGAIPAVLAYPNPRLHPDKFRQGLVGMSARSGLDWIFTEQDLEPIVRPLIEAPGSTIKGVHLPYDWDTTARVDEGASSRLASRQAGITPSAPFLLQHSSGTTGLQKPVLLSHRAVVRHVDDYAAAIALTERDKVISWLPLYHDMGLIAAFHLPMAAGVPTVMIDPFEWVLAPSLLLEAVSCEGGTISWLPNFAFNMMADKIAAEDSDGLRLDTWRLIVNCSEPVRQDSHLRFLRRFEKNGLRPLALSCCYAMAETTFAVTQVPVGTEPAVLAVSREELSRGRVRVADNGPDTRLCLSSGVPLNGCDVKIVNEQNRELPDGIVGEIAVHTPSMFDGYRNYPEKTSAVLRDGWYYTGDYGFGHAGHYYVIGRKKDIIIVAGNNISPEDVEEVVGRVDGVIPGRVVAFGEENAEIGSEQVAVAAETPIADERLRQRLRLEIIKAGMTIDVSIKSVHLVPPRFLIKSSAGKPSRSANRDLLANGVRCEWNTDDYERIEAGHSQKP
jgi:fatty-acyl-CoA synthase